MKNLLVVVDMQNDFIDGALGTKEAQEIVPAVIQRIRNFDGDVVYTRDTHGESYMETSVVYSGSSTSFTVFCGDMEILTEERSVAGQVPFARGDSVVLHWPADAAVRLED